MLHRKQNLQKI